MVWLAIPGTSRAKCVNTSSKTQAQSKQAASFERWPTQRACDQKNNTELPKICGGAVFGRSHVTRAVANTCIRPPLEAWRSKLKHIETTCPCANGLPRSQRRHHREALQLALGHQIRHEVVHRLIHWADTRQRSGKTSTSKNPARSKTWSWEMMLRLLQTSSQPKKDVLKPRSDGTLTFISCL